MKEKSLDKCSGCSLCALNCPVKAIADNMCEEENINKDRCIDCGLCHKICQQEVGHETTDMNGNIIKDGWEQPSIDEKLCTGCRLCVENCPMSCLELSEPKEHGDIKTFAVLARPDDCIGCGFCEKDCPISAIKLVKRK